jgi:hypothetical protein
VINNVDTRVFALLNISVVGQSTLSDDNPWGELMVYTLGCRWKK